MNSIESNLGISLLSAVVVAAVVLFATLGAYLAVSSNVATNRSESTSSNSVSTSVSLASSSTIASSSGLQSIGTTTIQSTRQVGLVVELNLNSVNLRPGQTITVTIGEYNNLPTFLNVTRSNGWALGSLQLNSCGNKIEPFGIALFSGIYSKDNVSSAKPLIIFPVDLLCAQVIEPSWYLFQPSSTFASTSINKSPYEIHASLNINGTWGGSPDGSRTFSVLQSGSYTVVAGDEWGNLAFAYFRVET